jgi:TolB-like protein
MRKFLFIIFGTLFFLLLNSNFLLAYEEEIKSLSTSMAETIDKAGKKTIAVVDFIDLQGNVTELGRLLAEEFSVALASYGKGFEVIDRTHLNTILKEHKLADTGVIDPATAKKLGQVAGVDALITGTITPLEDNIRILVKILDTATAKVIGASSGNIANTFGRLVGSGIGTETTGRATIPSELQLKTLLEVNEENFIFKATLCQARGKKVSCNISVTNDEPDGRTIVIYTTADYSSRRSIMIDDLGNQYKPIDVKFGTSSASTAVGFFLPSLRSNVPPNLPMNLELFYDGIATEAKYVSIILDIDVYVKGNIKPFKPILRNIPLVFNK